MPIYEYQCTACELEEERNVSIANRDVQNCDCGYEMERRISFTGLVWAPNSGGMK